MSSDNSGKAQNKADTLSQQEMNKRDTNVGDVNKKLGYFEGNGDPTSSGLYKSLLTTGTEATSDAYANANANMNRKANMAGFGYEQPVTQGANAELGAEEAKSMARVPGEALQQTINPEMQAIGMQEGESSLYQPLGYFNTYANLANARDQRSSAMWNNLLSSSLGAAGAAAA